MSKDKESIKNIIFDYKFNNLIQAHLLSLLRQSETPQDLANRIFELAHNLDILSRVLDENYRENWHGWECECDECISDDLKEEQRFLEWARKGGDLET